jgi:hypothetical protein
VTVLGVVEVKSGRKSVQALAGSLTNTSAGLRQGLIVGGDAYPSGQVHLGAGNDGDMVRVTVLPGEWPLPRTLRFEDRGEKKRELVLDPPVPSEDEDEFIPKGNGDWHIVLRWSREAIAAAAYEMTFWYMEKVGEAIYTQKDGEPDPKPKDWAEMTPAEAGRNAIKMMLYYAIRPDAILAEEAREQKKPLPRPIARRLSRAIALYNTYGFGYALGMNFRNPQLARREMLWPQDRLDEIALNGRIQTWGSERLFVIEFKVGEKHFTRADLDQVWDYALDLKNFHEASRAVPIMPRTTGGGRTAAVAPQLA